MQKKMVAFCGVVCTDCRAFAATQENDKELKKEVARAWSTEKIPLKPDDIECDGCLAVGRRLAGFCSTCEVRPCGLARGVKNCAHCDEYPCVKLTTGWKLAGGSGPKAILDEITKGLRA